MWRMTSGTRVLTEAEWNLFRVGVETLWGFIEDEGKGEIGLSETEVGVFDVLQPEQKLALLADVGQALRDPAIPPPRLTAANEGTVAAIFAVLRQALEMEVDLADMRDARTEVRSLLLAAAADSDDWPDELPTLEEPDFEEWFLLLETVETRILWDRDFEMGDPFMDQAPETSQALHALVGVDSDYFADVPREPDAAGMVAVRQTLERMLGGPLDRRE